LELLGQAPCNKRDIIIPVIESIALLAEDVYKQDINNRGVNGWEPDVITGTANNFDSGLQIQNYQNATHPNHTVIAIAGTNGLNDWDDNVSFIK
jgi:hypothetical protein